MAKKYYYEEMEASKFLTRKRTVQEKLNLIGQFFNQLQRILKNSKESSLSVQINTNELHQGDNSKVFLHFYILENSRLGYLRHTPLKFRLNDNISPAWPLLHSMWYQRDKAIVIEPSTTLDNFIQQMCFPSFLILCEREKLGTQIKVETKESFASKPRKISKI